jgi:hypothetical protein
MVVTGVGDAVSPLPLAAALGAVEVRAVRPEAGLGDTGVDDTVG